MSLQWALGIYSPHFPLVRCWTGGKVTEACESSRKGGKWMVQLNLNHSDGCRDKAEDAQTFVVLKKIKI